MSYQKIPLLAGVPFRLDIPGNLLLIDSPGAAGGVDVAVIVNGTPSTTMENRKGGFRKVGAFEGVILTVAVNSTVSIFLSMQDVNLGTNQLEISNSAANPVNVLFAGTVAPVVGTITNTDPQAIPMKPQIGAVFDVRAGLAAAVANVAPAAITAAASVVLTASGTRRGFRVKNVGANPVAIGGAGIVYASAVVLIQPGETWSEVDAPGAAWSAICDAALTSTLNIQTMA